MDLQYWLKQERFYGISCLKCAYQTCYPVPADCSLYKSFCHPKHKETNGYSNSIWCSKCPLYMRHCDGSKIKLNEDKVGEI